MENYKEVVGIVQQKVIDKSNEEFNTYTPRNGQLVIVTETVNDDTSASIYVGDGASLVKDCKTISGGNTNSPIILTGQTWDPDDDESDAPTNYPFGTLAITEWSDEHFSYRALCVYLGINRSAPDGVGWQVIKVIYTEYDEP